MRENKFRGIKFDYSGWMYGVLLEDVILSGIEEVNDEYVSITKWYSVNKETVGQYIGKKDKNGVEIYEGDIVDYEYFQNDSKISLKNRGEVLWDDESSRFYLSGIYSLSIDEIDYNNVLVVGNIHEGVLEND